MANSNTTVKAKSQDVDLTLTHNTTDVPLLPVNQIRELKEICPDRIDWLFEQTEREAEHRRTQQRRNNIFIAIERIGGMLIPVVSGIAGGVAMWIFRDAAPALVKPTAIVTVAVVVSTAGAYVVRRKR